ncbi:hypothetical protein KDW_04090 [Dictyobacter vulcani]|uniref:Transposase IS701-like DDE domain-containing protein n=1 Tax=Dictyobacter vulcani TaxID=2607529 RepID=A0A5J4KID4_9CHLR|nr:hypothetical protein KDW_04090 [Dictyobacter vulcani]
MTNSNTLRQFRHDIYDCFPRAKDALFNTIDGLMTEIQATSFPEISQSPLFERTWASLYEAFEDGRIDEKRLREILARYLPKPDAGKWLWIGIDASKIARPAAVTSADRTAQHMHNLPECKKPVTFGWQFSTVVALAEPVSSWTYILDQQRVASQTTAIEVAEEQLRQVVPYLPKQVIVVLDRGYDSNWLWCRCSALEVEVLGRLKSNRCFYRAAPPPTGKKGCPRKDGDKLQPKDPATHQDPDGVWKGTDEKERPVEVTWWKHMHVKQARYLDVTVLRVVRPHATNKERDPRVSWFVWIGDQEADVTQIALAMCCALGKSMAIVLTSNACCGNNHVCGPQNSLSDGAILWRSRTIIWSWLVTWLKQNGDHGKANSASQPPNRCGAGCTNCWHVWALLPGHHNHAENRKAG